MSKYLKLFETTSQYEAYMGGGEKILPNVSLIEETNKVEYNPYIPERYIIYTASEKLNKTWSDETATFGATIKIHTFENGVGTIEFNGNVTKIGSDAFYECTKLTSITIPDSVTSIGDFAFEDCQSLTSVTIPDSVTSIGQWAFYGCIGLTVITIPNSVTSIGDSAFSNCTSLPVVDNIRYADTCAAEAVDKTLSTYILKEDTRFVASTFYGCTNLTSITIPNSVTYIGGFTFEGCTNLESITIPNGVTSIGYDAFYGCTNLTSITVGNGNTVYDSRDNCNAIIKTATNTLTIGCQNTTIPNTVTSIGESAFNGCSGLASIIIPDSVTYIGSNVFRNCSSLTSITIPNSVTSIDHQTFEGCTNLTSIMIPNSVTSIGYDAFLNCTSLPVVDNIRYADTCAVMAVDKTLSAYTIKEGTRFIQSSAFEYCTNLASITIPDSVISIGENAFRDCPNLTSVTVESTTPPSLGNYVFFNNANGRKIYVPAEAVNTYKTATNWSTYASDIEAIPT